MRWGTNLTRLHRAELGDSFLKAVLARKTRERNVGTGDVTEIVTVSMGGHLAGERALMEDKERSRLVGLG